MWEIGPLRFTVQRLASEWLVALETIDIENVVPDWKFSYCDLDFDADEIPNLSRFVCQDTSESLAVLPALADR